MKKSIFISIPFISLLLLATGETNAQTSEPTSIYDIPRNSVTFNTNIFFNGLSYERIAPLGNKNGVSFGVGITYFIMGKMAVFAKLSFLHGGPMHLFEVFIEPTVAVEKNIDLVLVPGVGYRYQAPKGFLFKANVSYVNFDGPGVLPLIGIGYSFDNQNNVNNKNLKLGGNKDD